MRFIGSDSFFFFLVILRFGKSGIGGFFGVINVGLHKDWDLLVQIVFFFLVIIRFRKSGIGGFTVYRLREYQFVGNRFFGPLGAINNTVKLRLLNFIFILQVNKVSILFDTFGMNYFEILGQWDLNLRFHSCYMVWLQYSHRFLNVHSYIRG